MSASTIGTAINAALHAVFAADERVYLLGEDLLDPYGGAFKISKGLSTRWPDRVLTTPISEAAIVGIAGGMAMRGLRPVVEIMFGDFICLAFDQIVNHMTKFGPMYNGRASAPAVIRTPMGGGRGYGPTHSQSLEKYLVGVPGLNVVAPSHLHAIEPMYRDAICDAAEPTVIVEGKLLYGFAPAVADDGRLGPFRVAAGAGPYPTVTLSLNGFRSADVTIVTYGASARLAMETAQRMLIEHEVVADVVVLGRLAPLPVDDIVEAVRRSRRAVTLEEGTGRLGIGAEIASALTERLWGTLAAPVLRVAAADGIVPAARELEERMLPNAGTLERALLRAVKW